MSRKIVYRWNGRVISKAEYDKKPRLGTAKGGLLPCRQAITSGKPMKGTIGAAVHPDQVREFNELYRKHNIHGAHHNPDGTIEYQSRSSRRAVHKLRSLRDNDACYGDWPGKNG